MCAADRCPEAECSVTSSRRGWGMLLRLVRNGVVRVRFRSRLSPRLLGGLVSSALRRHRQRIFPSIPSPRRGCDPVRRWAGQHRRVPVPVWLRSAVVCWPGAPGHRRLMPRLLRRLRWLLRPEASVLRGECAVLPDEASVPSTGAAWSSTARSSIAGNRAVARRRTDVVCGRGSASSETGVKPVVSSTRGAVRTSHRRWL